MARGRLLAGPKQRNDDLGPVAGITRDIGLAEIEHVGHDPRPARSKGLTADAVKSDRRAGGAIAAGDERHRVTRLGDAIEAEPAHAGRSEGGEGEFAERIKSVVERCRKRLGIERFQKRDARGTDRATGVRGIFGR